MNANFRWTNTIHFTGMLTHYPKIKPIENRYGKKTEVCDFYLSQGYLRNNKLMVHCCTFNNEIISIFKNNNKICACNVVGRLDRDLKSKALRILVQNLEIAYTSDKELKVPSGKKGNVEEDGNENDSN